MCPIDFNDAEAQIGLALTVGLTVVFEPQPWDEECSTKELPSWCTQIGLCYMSQWNQGRYFSRIETRSFKFTSFVRKTGEPILFEQNIYVPVNKSFAIYPVSGATPWLTDKPPGAMRTQMDNTLRGLDFLQSGSCKGQMQESGIFSRHG